MHGNVWEWCKDVWRDDYSGAPCDGSAWSTSEYESSRIVRGGSWTYPTDFCRSAFRAHGAPNVRYRGLGFRVVLVFA